MKLFECQHCGHLLYFENTKCARCGHILGYLPDRNVLSALVREGEAGWRPLAAPERLVCFCANADNDVCNWTAAIDASETLCRACQLNRMVPDLERPGNLSLWRKVEVAKHRLVYSLLRLHLPLTSKFEDSEDGLAFDFLADVDSAFQETESVVTGHNRGLVTINIAEADDVVRERHRLDMAEPYRTVLGHLRHEVGHYYWQRLARDGTWLEPIRALFGDERQDYGASLAAHYANGPPKDWPERYITAYAGAHPWEDWAETWAHYLHIVDTMETAYAFRLRVQPQVSRDPTLAATIDFDPYHQRDFDTLIGAWLPLTYAVNSLNRSMGQPDLYPFVLAPLVLDKLRFVHELIRHYGADAS